MNRSAYLTTGLAIKALSRLSKADIVVHDKENIPEGPTIFVMNHFTRVETFLLPYYIYNLTGKPAWSLAAAELFKGGLEKFFDLVGVVSTSDPMRDELIVKSLLTGEANWIIFPEGSMVKTKKIVDGGRYMVAHPKGMHEPHTGAAALALRAELFRTHLMETAVGSEEKLQPMLKALGIDNFEAIVAASTSVVPVNLTYYPIRTAENIASSIASKLVKDIPDRMVEEIMTEGTMLLSGVDLDIRFGRAIEIKDYLKQKWLSKHMQAEGISGFSVPEQLKVEMKKAAYDVMQRYMDDIYAMTTVNHEHLFATFLRMYPLKHIREKDFNRRVFYAASLIGQKSNGLGTLYLHKSLQENQAHLLTDDRFKKYENFLKLAEDKGVVEKRGSFLIRVKDELSAPLSLHRGRIENPIEVMANEIEPLHELQSFLKKIAWQPETLLKLSLIRSILKNDREDYVRDCKKYVKSSEGKFAGTPYLLPSYRFTTGVLLIHSYLAVPEEVRGLATYLQRQGVWVYAVRLPGHGTSAEDLATRKYREWVEAVENGYAMLSSICKKIVVGGVAVGGSLGLDLAARVKDVVAAFAICPPYQLRNYSTNFMPSQDVWNRLLSKWKSGEKEQAFLDFSHGNRHVNYLENPVDGVSELGDFLESIETRYQNIRQPVLVVQADNNPVVDPAGSRQIYDALGSSEKEFCLLNYDRHVLVNGPGAEKIFGKIRSFLLDL
ncbi:MAG: alpha/beta fold hydrolase [Desulfobulbaceae bacterium]|nr:alpha/beta fold hydrolase [Desulfobulbaceae bacterium]